MTAGTNPVATFALPVFTVDDATTYRTKLDGNSAVAKRAIDAFAPHAATSPAMSVVVDAGFIVSLPPTGQQTVTEVAQQTVTITTAPTTPNNRIDLVVIAAGTGTASVVAGTPATSPTAPALPAGKSQIAQVSVPYGTATITGSKITDLRAVWTNGAPGLPWAIGGGTGNAITATYTPANAALTDGLVLTVRCPGANTSATPTFAPDGLTAHTITRAGGKALVPGDIPGNLSEAVLRYNLANTRWELLNPGIVAIPWAVAGGSANALTFAPTVPVAALYDGLLITGRATAANTTTAPTVAVSGLAATVVTKRGGAALVAGDIASGSDLILRYIAAGPSWDLVNAPSSAAALTGAAINAALGYTAGNAAYVGSMKGGVTVATTSALSNDQVGYLIRCTNYGGITLTLPTSGTPVGATFIFSFAGAGNAVSFAAENSSAVRIAGNVLYGTVTYIGAQAVYDSQNWIVNLWATWANLDNSSGGL